jgi:hypothetical protein
MPDNAEPQENGAKDAAIDQALKKTREKSVKYPYYNLKECIDYLSTIHSIGGKKEAPVEAVLSRLNLTSESSRRFTYLTSSAENFGLLEKTKQGIRPTEKGTLIIYPPFGESQRKQLLVESFKTPVLYQKIIDRYADMILPNKDLLKNIFYNMGIARNVLDQAVDSFVESAQFAEVLDTNNRLIVPIEGDNVNEQQNSQKNPSQTQQAVHPSLEHKSSESRQVSANDGSECDSPKRSVEGYHKIDFVISTGKTATVLLPQDITKKDVDKLKGLLDVFISE